jgi:hypothetical protein
MRAKWVLVSLVILGVGVAGWAWGSGRPRRVPATAAGPVLTMGADSPEPGIVTVWAVARITPIHRDNAVLWFSVAATRRTGNDDWEPAGTWEFADPEAGEMVRARQGVEARLVLKSRRIALPPGSYSVMVKVHEDEPLLQPDGLPEEVNHVMVANSAWVDVR